MANIVINDLEENRELDREAMTRVSGGFGEFGGYDFQGSFYAPLIGGGNFSPFALAYGQYMGDYWGSQLSFAQSYGSSSFDFLNTLNNIVAWAGSPIYAGGQRIF